VIACSQAIENEKQSIDKKKQENTQAKLNAD